MLYRGNSIEGSNPSLSVFWPFGAFFVTIVSTLDYVSGRFG